MHPPLCKPMKNSSPARKQFSSVTGQLLSTAIVLAMAYVAVLAGMYFFQRDLQYRPGGTKVAPSDIGLPHVKVITLETSDHERLLAWHHEASPGMPTILYFHGNGGGISTRPRKQAFFAALGFGVLAVSYRGYEGSTGSPSEAGLILDAEAAYEWLKVSGISGDKLYIHGESLGTGIAVQIAAKHTVGAVALEAPYASAVDVGAATYWFLPVRWLMKDQFRSTDHIKNMKAPVFIIHGTDDWTVPYTQGQKLFALANEPKHMSSVDGGGHDIISDEQTWKQIADFFTSINIRVAE